MALNQPQAIKMTSNRLRVLIQFSFFSAAGEEIFAIFEQNWVLKPYTGDKLGWEPFWAFLGTLGAI